MAVHTQRWQLRAGIKHRRASAVVLATLGAMKPHFVCFANRAYRLPLLAKVAGLLICRRLRPSVFIVGWAAPSRDVSGPRIKLMKELGIERTPT